MTFPRTHSESRPEPVGECRSDSKVPNLNRYAIQLSSLEHVLPWVPIIYVLVLYPLLNCNPLIGGYLRPSLNNCWIKELMKAPSYGPRFKCRQASWTPRILPYPISPHTPFRTRLDPVFSVSRFVKSLFVMILVSEMKNGKCQFANGTASTTLRNRCARWSLIPA